MVVPFLFFHFTLDWRVWKIMDNWKLNRGHIAEFGIGCNEIFSSIKAFKFLKGEIVYVGGKIRKSCKELQSIAYQTVQELQIASDFMCIHTWWCQGTSKQVLVMLAKSWFSFWKIFVTVPVLNTKSRKLLSYLSIEVLKY